MPPDTFIAVAEPSASAAPTIAAPPIAAPPIAAPPSAAPPSATPPSAAPSLAAARLPTLDALRGLAIVLVLCYHFAPHRTILAPMERVMRATMHAGWVGVDLFFVLSGFLITGILLDCKGEPGALPRFYGRRALRILPLYYVALAVLLGIALLARAAGVDSPSGASLLQDQPWYWLHAANFAAARDVAWAEASWVQHLWSLAVEEQFYLAWPAVVLLVPPRRLPHAIGIVVVGAFATRMTLTVIGGHAVGAYVLMPARADALAMGALLALAWRTPAWHDRVTRVARVTVPLMLAVLLAFAFGGGPSPHAPLTATIGLTFGAFLFSAMIWLAVAPVAAGDDGATARATRAWQSWLARHRWLHLMGRYSYGLYVVHYPLRALLESLGLTSAEFDLSMGFWLASALSLALGVALSLAVAVPLWHLLEAPVMRHGGRWLDARLSWTRSSRTPDDDPPDRLLLAPLPAP